MRQMKLTDLAGSFALDTLTMAQGASGGCWIIVRARDSMPPHSRQILLTHAADGPLSMFDATIETSFPDDQSGLDAAFAAMTRAIARENR